MSRICLIEDDAIMGESLADRFTLEGFACDWHRNARSALAALRAHRYSVAISDYSLPDMTGERLFEDLRKTGVRMPPFIFITGFGSIDTAVRLLKLGAADYITKPFDLDLLVEKVHAACAAGAPEPAGEGFVLGISPPMRRIQETLPRLAERATTLLITGESGVGKEEVAREFHRLAAGAAESPFIAVNCGAIPESLMEAELFGHEKGAFTGAIRARKGLFEQAHGGTLFLDEIGEMTPAMQVKLLRTIQERRIVRVGGETPVEFKARLVCATHRELKEMVEKGSFREDLYYRIHVIQIRIPPLRERLEDILWLARRFLAGGPAASGTAARSFSPSAEQALLAYPWPGNVRELKHCIERACILYGDALLGEDALFGEIGLPASPVAQTPADLGEYLRDCETRYIRDALLRCDGQLGRTATSLGISRKNLWEKMKKLGIHGRAAAGVADDDPATG